MPKIGVLYGMENSFPSAFVDYINNKEIRGLTAEHIRVGGVKMAEPSGFDVIVDRISQDVEFYRAYLRNAAISGARVINDPFRWTAHDKFAHYSIAQALGLHAPRTVVLPHKAHPPGTTVLSLRNLLFPLNWDEIFDYAGFPAFLKPMGKGGLLSTRKVSNRDEFFAAYDESGPACMMLQAAVEFEKHYRVYIVGEEARVLRYQPHQPAHLRFTADEESGQDFCESLLDGARRLTERVGYDINAVDFAVLDSVAYVIDSFNPAPEADAHSFGQANFEWFVRAAGDLAIAAARGGKAKTAAAIG